MQITKTIAAAAAAASVAAGLIASSAATAEARPGCVSRAEFRNTNNGATLLNLEYRYETHGRLEGQGGGYKHKSYRACYGPDTARVYISYRHYNQAWRVDYKYYVADPD